METVREPAGTVPANYGPVADELTAFDLPVQGAIPPELAGRYLRNGPNPRSGDPAHWFFGDGMVHGVALRDGRAQWYRNRWVRTRQLTENAAMVGPDGSRDLTTGPANTHLVSHAGRLLALVESSLPTEITAELDTLGPYDFGGRLRTPMTAHPKRCPRTGELHLFGYDFAPPYLTYHRVDAAGELVQTEVIDLPGPVMMHDFAITERHVLFLDLPVVFDLDLALGGTMPYRWSDSYGARVGVMPRGGRASDIRWYDVAPCYVFHTLNAYDEPGAVVLDVVRYPELWRDDAALVPVATLHRWRIDLAAGTVRESVLDDRPVEFPRIDERRTGLVHRLGWAVSGVPEQVNEGLPAGALVGYDLAGGTTALHRFPAGQAPGEAVFVPSAGGTSEADGWLLCYVYDAARDGSDLVVLDASDLPAPPLARVALPQRVPFGFHGSWFPD